MNYKKIIPNQRIRFFVLKNLKWVPDIIMLPLQYRIKMGRWPNLKHPKRYTEKILLYKMRYRNPLMSQCVDKYEVRAYVKSRGLSNILNDVYGVYDKAEDIRFEDLPSRFVAKTTDGSGGQNILIVKDKSQLIKTHFISRLDGWLGRKDIDAGREWAYTGIKSSRIILERLLEDQNNKDGAIDDYKFFCFNGQMKAFCVDKDRYFGHKRGFWNEKYEYLTDVSSDEPSLLSEIPLPNNIREMVSVAEVLSAGFPHARIDLYNIKGKIYFGEITFYPWSGYVMFKPQSFDVLLGSYFTEY